MTKKTLKIFLAFILCFGLFLSCQTPILKVLAETTYPKTDISIKNSNFESDTATETTPSTSVSNWTVTSSDSEVVKQVVKTDTTNVLSISSENDKYFTMESASISLSRYSYYLISIKAKTFDEAKGALMLFDSSNKVLIRSNIQETGAEFVTYSVLYATGATTKSVNIAVSLGISSEEKSSGKIYYDDAKIERINEKTFNEKAATLPSEKALFNLKNLENFDGELGANVNLNGNELVDVLLEENELYNDNTLNNSKAILLKGKDGGSKIEVKNIDIKALKTYVFAINVKILNELSNTNLSISLDEQSGLINTINYNKLKLNFDVKSTGSSEEDNGFRTYLFYIKGDIFYDTKCNLTINLNESNKTAIIDSIRYCDTIEEKDFDSTSKTSSSSAVDNIRKEEISSKTITAGAINNGYFNKIDFNSLNASNYYMPDSWSFSPSSPSKSGVKIQDNKTSLILYAGEDASQSLTSTSFALNSNTNYEISFKIDTTNLPEDSILTAIIYSNLSLSDNTTRKNIYKTINIQTGLAATDYKMYVATGSASESLYIQFELNHKDKTIQGSAEIFNVTAYEVSRVSVDKANLIDFGCITNDDNGKEIIPEYKKFEIVKNYNETDKAGDLMLYETTSTIDDTNNIVKAVLVDENGAYGSFNPDEFTSKYLLMIKNLANGTDEQVKTTIKQIKATTLEANQFYKITISILANSLNEDDTLVLEFDGLTNKITANKADELQTYSLYLASAKDTLSTKLSAVLTSVNNTNTSTVFIDGYQIEKITQTDFEGVNDRTLCCDLRTEADEDHDEHEDHEHETEAGDENNDRIDTSIWFWIPTCLLGVSVIIVLAVVAVRRIKIKRKVVIKNKYKTTTKRILTESKIEANSISEEKANKLKIRLEKLNAQLENVQAQLNEKTNNNIESVKAAKNSNKDLDMLMKTKNDLTEKIKAITDSLNYVSTKEYKGKTKKEIASKKRVKQSKNNTKK